MIRQFYLVGEAVKRSIEWLIKRLIKAGAKIAYHGRRWPVHVASVFPLAGYYGAVFGLTNVEEKTVDGATEGAIRSETG